METEKPIEYHVHNILVVKNVMKPVKMTKTQVIRPARKNQRCQPAGPSRCSALQDRGAGIIAIISLQLYSRMVVRQEDRNAPA